MQGPQMLLGAESRHTGRTGGEALGAGHTGTLDSQRLAHNGATTSEDLEVGHGAAAGTGAGTGGCRERAEGRGRGAFEERAHCPGLLEEGLHWETMQLCWFLVSSWKRENVK